MKKAIVLIVFLLAAVVAFGQNDDIFSMLEVITNNFPKTEDATRRIMTSNGFISSGKDRYINSFDGVSIESWSEDEHSANGTNITFIFNFNSDVYFVKFIREYLSYFSNRDYLTFNGSNDKINYYVFYKENDPATLTIVYDTYKNDVVIWVSRN